MIYPGVGLAVDVAVRFAPMGGLHGDVGDGLIGDLPTDAIASSQRCGELKGKTKKRTTSTSHRSKPGTMSLSGFMLEVTECVLT